MKEKNLLMVLVIIGFVQVLMFTACIVGIAVIGSEVKPLINEVKVGLDSFELPDFSSLNLMSGKMEHLLLKVDELLLKADKLPLDKVDDFIVIWDKLDEADVTDLIVDILPLFKDFLLKETNNTGEDIK